MSRNEKVDHSAFVTARTMAAQKSSLFTVFTFTTIVLLLTMFPDPSQTMVQATIFVLTLFFYLCSVDLFTQESVLHYCTRHVPPIPRSLIKRAYCIIYLTWILLPAILVLMFLSWNLTYLALATGISGIFAIIFALLQTSTLQKVVKKYEVETGKTWIVRKFFDERDIMFEDEG